MLCRVGPASEPFSSALSAFYNIAMSYHGLAEFLERLAEAGELVRVEAAVDPTLEIAEITGRVASSGGPALLFSVVEGRRFPVLTNLLGTESRICRALEVESLREVAERIAGLVHPSDPEGWFEKILSGPARAALRRLVARPVRTGACQQVVRLGGDIDLDDLPVLRAWPGEPGPTITAGMLVAADAASGRAHVGRYDLRPLDRDRMAACWHPHEEPARLLAGYAERRSKMPVAVVLGGDPAELLAAMAPLPPGADVAAVAGLLRNKPVDVVKCRAVELEVPADAEFVVEGTIDPAEPPVEFGWLAGPGGHYCAGPPSPVIRVTAMTHRTNPIYPALVRGRHAHEEIAIGRALHRVFRPLVELAIPELADYDLPAFGAARHWGFVAIRKDHAGQARRVAQAVWGLRPLMFTKFLVIVDEEVDVRDAEQVWSAVAAHADPRSDVFFGEGPADPWDPATAPGTLGCRMAIDATAKLPGERAAERLGPAAASEEVRRRVSERWPQYGLGAEGP